MANASDLLQRNDNNTYSYESSNGVVTGPQSYVFLAALQEHNPEVYNLVPNLFKRQLTEQAYDRPFLDAEILNSNIIRAALEDPQLVNIEDIPEYFDEDFYMEFSVNTSDNKYTELSRDIPRFVKQFRGVTVRLHLTGILDADGELVRQEPSKRGSLPPGQAWLTGHRSNVLRLTEESVDSGLISRADYQSLHYYAVFGHVLTTTEGERAFYNREHTGKRIWFTPENDQARIEFELVSRNKPGTLEETIGLADIAWTHVKGLGLFCGANSQISGVSTVQATRAAAPRAGLPLRAAAPAAVPASATLVGTKREKQVF